MDTNVDSNILWKVISAILLALTTLLGWIGARTINKVDDCVTRNELAEMIEALREDVTTTRDRIDRIWEHIGK